jgi:DNA-binding transcriptional MocR family regulator
MFECAEQLIRSGMAFDMAHEQMQIAIQRQLIAAHVFAESLPDLHYQSQTSSYHLWLTLPKGWQAQNLVQTAKEHGLLLSSGHFFEVKGEASQCLRISLMAISEESEFKIGLQQLVELIKRENTGSKSG